MEAGVRWRARETTWGSRGRRSTWTMAWRMACSLWTVVLATMRLPVPSCLALFVPRGVPRGASRGRPTCDRRLTARCSSCAAVSSCVGRVRCAQSIHTTTVVTARYIYRICNAESTPSGSAVQPPRILLYCNCVCDRNDTLAVNVGTQKRRDAALDDLRCLAIGFDVWSCLSRTHARRREMRLYVLMSLIATRVSGAREHQESADVACRELRNRE